MESDNKVSPKHVRQSCLEFANWNNCSMNCHLIQRMMKGPIAENLIETTCEEEEKVSFMINQTFPQLKVKEIRTVQNDFLEAMYLLKKEECKSRYGKAEEMLLFHVTSASHVNSIICNNFDWRKIKRGKFGLGTSFSGDAAYANRYANYNIGDKRAIIVTKVLVCNKTGGREGLKIPKRKYDTTTGSNNKVYVKFSDNEVLPKYVVFYNADFSKKKKTNEKKHIKNYQPGSNFYNEESYDYNDGSYDYDDENDFWDDCECNEDPCQCEEYDEECECGEDPCQCEDSNDGECECGEDPCQCEDWNDGECECGEDPCQCEDWSDGECECGEDPCQCEDCNDGECECGEDPCQCEDWSDGECECGEDPCQCEDWNDGECECGEDPCQCEDWNDGECGCGEDPCQCEDWSDGECGCGEDPCQCEDWSDGECECDEDPCQCEEY